MVFQAFRKEMINAAITTSLRFGIKIRKNIEISLAPSNFADFIISFGSKRAFCLNKYKRKGTDIEAITTAKYVFNIPKFLNNKNVGIKSVASGMYIA